MVTVSSEGVAALPRRATGRRLRHGRTVFLALGDLTALALAYSFCYAASEQVGPLPAVSAPRGSSSWSRCWRYRSGWPFSRATTSRQRRLSPRVAVTVLLLVRLVCNDLERPRAQQTAWSFLCMNGRARAAPCFAIFCQEDERAATGSGSAERAQRIYGSRVPHARPTGKVTLRVLTRGPSERPLHQA